MARIRAHNFQAVFFGFILSILFILVKFNFKPASGRIDEMSEDLVTIACYVQAVEARLVQTKLESVGIESYIIDENFSALYNNFPQFGGIRLQVAQDDAERARKILGRVDKGEEVLDEQMVYEQIDPGEDPADPTDVCPNCGAADIAYQKPERLLVFLFAFFSTLFLGRPLKPLFTRTLECSRCRHIWKPGN